MSELASRYFRAPQGCLELPGVTERGRFIYAWLYQSPSRDVTPGLLRLGPGGLAEEMKWPAGRVRRHLGELGGHVLVDEAARVIFILGAVHHDPPRTVQQVTAMARQISQIPPCAPKAAAIAEIEARIKNLDKSLIDKWAELSCRLNTHGHSSRESSTPTHTHTQTPTPTPIQTPKDKSLGADAPTFNTVSKLVEDVLAKRKPADSYTDDIENIKAAYLDYFGRVDVQVNEVIKKAYDAVVLKQRVEKVRSQQRGNSGFSQIAGGMR